jgi:hypothetical protein
MAETVKEIVDWMRDNPQLLDWDVIAAVDITELDSGFAEAHLTRWRNGLDLGEIEGDFRIGTFNTYHYLSGLRLGAVRVDVDFNNADRPVIKWRMAVEGGTRTIVQNPRKVRSMSRFDLLSPAHLLSRTPLENQNGQLVMDVSVGEEYKFDESLGDLEQLEGGRFFGALFKDNDPERVRYVIAGANPSADNPFLASQHIVASTWTSADGKRVALLLRVTLKHGVIGKPLGPGGDFPFPLPAEIANDTRGTLLLNYEGMQRAAFGFAVEQMLEGGVFEYASATNGKLVMNATAGTLPVSAIDHENAGFNFESDAFVLKAFDLEIDFQDAEPIMRWSGTFDATFRYWRSGSGDRPPHKATFNIDLDYRFQLFHDSVQTYLAHGAFFPFVREQDEVIHVSSVEGVIAPDELAHVQAFFAYAIYREVSQALARKLTARSPERFLEQFALADVKHFVAQQAQVEAPNNLALFAPLSSQPVQFSIKEQHVMLKPRDEKQFNLDTEIPNVQWTVVPLPGSSGAWGTIDANGKYKAPSANNMGPLETRVLVVATDPATNAQSMSKVTVLVNAVSVNPLIYVTNAGTEQSFTVELSAGALEGGELTWTLNGTGSLAPGKDNQNYIYTPPAEPDYDVSYTVDEVEVTSKSGERFTSLVLVEHMSPLLDVVIAAETEAGVQLEARYKGKPKSPITWSKHHKSPGNLTEAGVYEPDFNAAGRFALLFAEYYDEDGDLSDGYLILPLPLAETKAVRALLTPRRANLNHQN